MAERSLLSSHFRSCTLTPITGDQLPSSTTILSSDGEWKTSSFYLDSSGRSSIPLLLQLQFPSADVLQQFVAEGCISPEPNKVDNAEGVTPRRFHGANSLGTSRFSIEIEARVTLTLGRGEAVTAEGVTITSTEMREDCIYFDAEIIVRVSREGGERIGSGDVAGVKSNIEITAVLWESLPDGNPFDIALDNLESLNLRGVPDLSQSPSPRTVRLPTRLHPVTLHATLTHALDVAVRSVPGPSAGDTFLLLTLSHSNTHSKPITVRNITMHPGHSWLSGFDATTGVVDMSKSVKWSYAPQMDPSLPFTLEPHEAITTVIVVEATEENFSRKFCCHLSAMAVLGKGDTSAINRNFVFAAAEAEWTTSRAAAEPKALKMDVKPLEQKCIVGVPLTVVFEIQNLSSEVRDLVLVVMNDHDERVPRPTVLSEKDGRDFGVWGLAQSGSYDALVTGEHGLMAVDMAFRLGELKGLSSTVAKLRLIPSKEGALRLPGLKLFDKRKNVLYNTHHEWKVVAIVENDPANSSVITSSYTCSQQLETAPATLAEF